MKNWAWIYSEDKPEHHSERQEWMLLPAASKLFSIILELSWISLNSCKNYKSKKWTSKHFHNIFYHWLMAESIISIFHWG